MYEESADSIAPACACHSSDRLRRGIAVLDPEQLLQLAKLVPELHIVLVIA